MQQSSHNLDRLGVEFSEPNLISNAGLLLPATLARQLGLGQLLSKHVDLGDAVGHAHVADKALTLIASVLAGGDCINDAAALRAAGSEKVLGHKVAAPSTLGSYLRSFSFGHARQLDKVSGEALCRAWGAGAGPGKDKLTIDIDSTVIETYGQKKQGGADITYHGGRGYHPLLATAAELGDVIHSRL